MDYGQLEQWITRHGRTIAMISVTAIVPILFWALVAWSVLEGRAYFLCLVFAAMGGMVGAYTLIAYLGSGTAPRIGIRVALVVGVLLPLLLIIFSSESSFAAKPDEKKDASIKDAVAPKAQFPLIEDEVEQLVQRYSEDPKRTGLWKPVTLDDIQIDRASEELTQFVAPLGYAEGFTMQVTKGRLEVIVPRYPVVIASPVTPEKSLNDYSLFRPQEFSIVGDQGFVQVKRQGVTGADHEHRFTQFRITEVMNPPNTAIIRDQADLIPTGVPFYWGVVPRGESLSGRPLDVAGHIGFVRKDESSMVVMPEVAFQDGLYAPQVWLSRIDPRDPNVVDKLAYEEPFVMHGPIWDIRGHKDLGYDLHLYINLPPTWPPTRVIVIWCMR